MSGTLHILTGPTAVGKSSLALAWAKAVGGEILSCDALQVYRGMDIGTAKPSAQERHEVPHHGLDLCLPDTPFSVKAFADYAWRVVNDVFSRGRPLIVCGGSGFYLKAFFANVADTIAVPESIAAQVRTWERDGGCAQLESELRRRNPEGIGQMDVRNPRRLVSALGRCMASGKTLAQMQAEFAAMPCRFDIFKRKTVLLTRSVESLKGRVAQRVDLMLAQGLLDEVRALAPLLAKNPTAASAIGYREPLEWIAAGMPTSLASLSSDIAVHTCQLLRKQRTWFRHQIHADKIIDLDGEVPSVSELFERA